MMDGKKRKIEEDDIFKSKELQSEFVAWIEAKVKEGDREEAGTQGFVQYYNELIDADGTTIPEGNENKEVNTNEPGAYLAGAASAVVVATNAAKKRESKEKAASSEGE